RSQVVPRRRRPCRAGRARRVALRARCAVKSTTHALTGLNSYVLRLCSGELIYTVAPFISTGYTRDLAQVWLWEPERLEAEVLAAQARMPWAGAITAVRARP